MTLRAPAKSRFALDLYGANRTRVAHAATVAGAAAVRTTICGSRSFRATVTRLSAPGGYRLTISRP